MAKTVKAYAVIRKVSGMQSPLPWQPGLLFLLISLQGERSDYSSQLVMGSISLWKGVIYEDKIFLMSAFNVYDKIGIEKLFWI